MPSGKCGRIYPKSALATGFQEGDRWAGGRIGGHRNSSAGPSMFRIRRPDRHLLPRITPSHDDGEAPRQRDQRLAHGGSFGDRQCPVFELQLPLVARQHGVRGFIEKCAHLSIVALRDAAGIVDLT
jgi:hypothetical protein